MRRANRKDTVHQPIVEGLQAHGIIVYDMPDPGDILCYAWSRAKCYYIWVPMELKSGKDVRKKKADGSDDLTPRQKRLQEKRSGAPIPLVHSLAEALALFGLSE